MAGPTAYQADFPALFVDWATSKIARYEKLIESGSLTDAETQMRLVDISYLKAAIERIAESHA